MRTKIIIILCLAALLTGCEQAASKIDVVESRRELTGVIERGTEELNAQHLKMMQDDIEGLKVEIERAKANAAEANNAAKEASLKAIAEEQARLQDLKNMREFVSIFVPAQAGKVIDLAAKGLDAKIVALDSLTKDIQSETKAASERINSTQNKLATVDSAIGKVNDMLMAVATSAKTAAIIAERNKEDTNALEGDLGDKTTEGLIGLIVAAGAATSGGSALARRGPSRARDDVKRIDQNVTDILKLLVDKGLVSADAIQRNA